MKTKRLIALITAASLIMTPFLSFPVFADISPCGKTETGAETREYLPGEAIICICPEISDEKRIAAGLSSFISTRKGTGSAVLKRVHSDSLSTEELISLYSGKPGVLFAEPNYII